MPQDNSNSSGVEEQNTKLQKFVSELIGKWYESAPYGDQIPDELPRLFAGFCKKHGHRDTEGMWSAFETAEPGDPILLLFECIFATAATFTVYRLSDAVFDRKAEELRFIDLEPFGTLATPENDPNPDCKHQHIMHPNCGGRMLFVDRLRSLNEPEAQAGNTLLVPQMERWESVAYWPHGTCGNNDVSTDTHDTKEAAEAVCRMLERKGFGGAGWVFPTRTEVRKAPSLEPTAPNADKAEPRIYTRCPACRNTTLTINDDKHLLCTWITCPDPTLIDRLTAETPESASCNRSVQGQGDEGGKENGVL